MFQRYLLHFGGLKWVDTQPKSGRACSEIRPTQSNPIKPTLNLVEPIAEMDEPNRISAEPSLVEPIAKSDDPNPTVADAHIEQSDRN